MFNISVANSRERTLKSAEGVISVSREKKILLAHHFFVWLCLLNFAKTYQRIDRFIGANPNPKKAQSQMLKL